MKPENTTEGQMVRDRRLLCFGYVDKVEGKRIIFVNETAIRKVDVEDLDPVAVIVPILMQLECPVCGARSNRKPFTGWVVERCPDCGENYSAGPFQVGPPLEAEPC
jgi:tRNA(Ile2) C34 agmatinyltransferase TiaS